MRSDLMRSSRVFCYPFLCLLMAVSGCSSGPVNAPVDAEKARETCAALRVGRRATQLMPPARNSSDLRDRHGMAKRKQVGRIPGFRQWRGKGCTFILPGTFHGSRPERPDRQAGCDLHHQHCTQTDREPESLLRKWSSVRNCSVRREKRCLSSPEVIAEVSEFMRMVGLEGFSEV